MEDLFCNMADKKKYKIKAHYPTRLSAFVDKLDKETKKIISNGINVNRQKA